MQRYNFALLPADKSFQDFFAQLAQFFFASSQDGYILADDALAHITLCQFRAANDQAALDAFHSFADKENDVQAIEEFHFRAGTAEHSGFFWAEFLVEKKQSLLERQKNCFAHLVAQGLEPLTPVQTFLPHITLARVKHRQDNVPSLEGAVLIKEFRPAIGVATENGIFVRELNLLRP